MRDDNFEISPEPDALSQRLDAFRILPPGIEKPTKFESFRAHVQYVFQAADLLEDGPAESWTSGQLAVLAGLLLELGEPERARNMLERSVENIRWENEQARSFDIESVGHVLIKYGYHEDALELVRALATRDSSPAFSAAQTLATLGSLGGDELKEHEQERGRDDDYRDSLKSLLQEASGWLERLDLSVPAGEYPAKTFRDVVRKKIAVGFAKLRLPEDVAKTIGKITSDELKSESCIDVAYTYAAMGERDLAFAASVQIGSDPRKVHFTKLAAGFAQAGMLVAVKDSLDQLDGVTRDMAIAAVAEALVNNRIEYSVERFAQLLENTKDSDLLYRHASMRTLEAGSHNRAIERAIEIVEPMGRFAALEGVLKNIKERGIRMDIEPLLRYMRGAASTSLQKESVALEYLNARFDAKKITFRE